MNCFVIMPFGPDFDDVYASIKLTVEAATTEPTTRCFRLDEHRPAGRITMRLLSELRRADVCMADVSGTRPNVMWELGYVMALEKPTILITQDQAALPFDVQDMQCVVYDRSHLTTTLSVPLRRCLLDTLNHLSASPGSTPASFDAVTPLMRQIDDLRAVVKDLVQIMRPAAAVSSAGETDELHGFAGHWLNTENGSHVYPAVLDGKLVAPYSFGGDRSLTGIYHGWRRVGDYWYGQFHWIHSAHAGFTFLKQQRAGTLVGAWWFEDEASASDEVPPEVAGVQSTWVKQSDAAMPRWASDCLEEIRTKGLAAVLKLPRT